MRARAAAWKELISNRVRFFKESDSHDKKIHKNEYGFSNKE